MKKPYIIAEIGVNFYDTASVENITPMSAAKKYIDEAKRVGIEAVKFQSYKADTIVSQKSPAYWDLKKEPTRTQYELFAKHDKFSEKEYWELYQYCKMKQIEFLSTPFDYPSVDYLNEMVSSYKISSSDITNLPFLKYIAKKGKPILLSTGASFLSEIEEAVRVILQSGCQELSLLHCVLSYPCKDEDANLFKIKSLKSSFPELRIGYSDHTLPDENMTILTTAYLYGAEVIEKHFTLDKTLNGNDHYHAGDPTDFQKAIKNFELISKISGDGKIDVLPCENIPRREARRSLVLTRNIEAGEKIGEKDLMAKRPGTGIAPKYSDIVIGRAAKMPLTADTVLMWEMI